MAVDARLRSPRRPHADLRLRADARGCDCGVRQERAARLLRFNDLAICPCRRYLNGRHSGHGTQQKRCSMTRPILAVLVLAISIPPLYAQGTILHTDRSGYTTGIDGNRTVNTYTDRYGYTRGTIGRDQVNTYTDRSGFTTGTIGRRRVNCFTDRLRTTKCY